MKPHLKTAAISALQWAFGLSAGFILGPMLISFISGTAISEKLLAEKLIVGSSLFLIIFVGLWLRGIFSKK